MKTHQKRLLEYINNVPKTELHLHIEGSLEPEMMFKLATRNNIKLNYRSPEEIKKAYNFNNLQDFLDIYYQGASVLLKEEDFYDLTVAYIEKAAEQNIIHTEIFFDPQTHTSRGVPFEHVIQGISRALKGAERRYGITSRLIMCFLRHLSQEDAFKTLEEALPYKNKIYAVGLDSSEKGFPPSKFKDVFSKSLEEGFFTVAHAGEEGPAEYIRESIDLLKVYRIDHGNHLIDDSTLLSEIIHRRIPLTMCPLSNKKLKVQEDLTTHPIKKMMDKGVVVTVNSDDPAYFGGYLNENLIEISEALTLTIHDIYRLVRNSVAASFANKEEKEKMFKKIEDFHWMWQSVW